ncbi:hypothetical protein FD42_GL002551 [Lentilactobacillus hilgardii DSM 20176 = ATCC 8290]|nr:hypothetical protein FD42_GL002551 [Lentilactobacillus hilgardii DSM 20176 = ATCC 8290]
MNRLIESGTFIEMDGELVGRIEMVNKNTLLIRKATKVFLNDKEIVALNPEAVYVNRELIESAYWIKLIRANTWISESLDLKNRRELIGKCLNM